MSASGSRARVALSNWGEAENVDSKSLKPNALSAYSFADRLASPSTSARKASRLSLLICAVGKANVKC